MTLSNAWFQCTVFDFIFYCVTLHTLYRIEVTKISSEDCEVHNLYVNAKVSFAGSLRNVNQILVVSSLLHSRTDCLSIYIIFTNCRKFSLICVQYDIEISQFRLSSSNILLSDRERIIFSLFVMNNCRFYSTGSQSNAILRRQQNLYWLVSWLTNTKCSEDDHFQTGTNGKQWRSVIAGTNHFLKIMVASMWHLNSWTSVTEMAEWSTTGFFLQCQSRMNQTSQDENYNNNQLEDIVLMYQRILRTLLWREMKDS